MDELDRVLERMLAEFTLEQRERYGPAYEELREAIADLRLAETVREDAAEAQELVRRFHEQAREDLDRAGERVRRAGELLGLAAAN
jgi:hypothetical protein